MTKKFRAIIFDLGGVLYNIDIQRSVAAFARLGLQDFDELYNLKEQTEMFDALETGGADLQRFTEHINRISGRQLSSDEVRDAWCELLVEFPSENVEILRELKQDYKLYLLSNTNAIHLERIDAYMQEHHQVHKLADLFDTAHYSFEMGLRKPGREIYEKVLEMNELEPGSTVFIDDSPANIEGAQEAGIHGIYKERSRPLKEVLEEHKLL